MSVPKWDLKMKEMDCSENTTRMLTEMGSMLEYLAQKLQDTDDIATKMRAEKMSQPGGAPRRVADLNLPLIYAPGYFPLTEKYGTLLETCFEKKDKNNCQKPITGFVRNHWYSRRFGRVIKLIQDFQTKKITLEVSEHLKADLLVGTYIASQVWSRRAEIKAMKKLRTLTSEMQFHGYCMTGTFGEVSKKSKVTYVFRRLRPTLALRYQKEGMCFLAALCMHPVAYYGISWAGALVPTDDIIAHLLMMRSDEHRFWKKSTQHKRENDQADF